MAVNTYYFDGSGGISDPDSAWSNDANAFDGSTSTVATSTASSFGDTDNLIGIGTTAPSSGGDITQVRARGHDGSSYSSWETLSFPSGGWSWGKVQNLYLQAYQASMIGGIFVSIFDSTDTQLSSFSVGSGSTFSIIGLEVTTAEPPTVLTGSISNITPIYAEASGEVTSDGGAAITDSGVVYSTSQNPTTADNKSSSGTAQFVLPLSGLSSDTTYYWRAYAINSEGTSYGSEKSFTTLKAPQLSTFFGGYGPSIPGSSYFGQTVGSFVVSQLLEIDDITSLSELEPVSFTQKHVLAVDDLTSQSELDSTSFTQKHTLSVDGLTSDSELEQPTFTIGFILSVDDLVSDADLPNTHLSTLGFVNPEDLDSASQLDNITLTQKHTLVVDDMTSLSELDTASTVENFTLAVDDLISESELDIASTVMGYTLVTDSLTSESELEASGFTQKHTLDANNLTSESELTNTEVFSLLQPANLTSESELESVDLVQGYTLSIQDLVSETELTSSPLSQKHTLAVEDLTSLSELEQATLVTQLSLAPVISESELEDVVLTQKHTLTVGDAISFTILGEANVREATILKGQPEGRGHYSRSRSARGLIGTAASEGRGSYSRAQDISGTIEKDGPGSKGSFTRD